MLGFEAFLELKLRFKKLGPGAMKIADRGDDEGHIEDKGGALEEIGSSLASINFVVEICRERAYNSHHRSSAID